MTASDHVILLRPWEARDAEQLIALWNRVFGDPPELAERFLALLPGMGRGAVAERDRQILGAAYLIHGFMLSAPGSSPVRCGYLYAVGVDKDARGLGLGTALSREAAALGRQNGAEILCTLPAEGSLYRWYGEILDLRHRTERTAYRSRELPPAEALRAEDYSATRETLLREVPHVTPTPASMAFQQELCRVYGGGLFRFEDGIFCAYQEADGWVVPELLLFDPLKPVPEAFSPVTVPYLCSDAPLPEGFIWNLTFD